MKNIGYYNGETGLLEDLKVPFLDRVSFYGDGVYDATMALDGVVVFAEDHIDRFFNSCANMEIDPGIGREDLQHLLTDLVAKVDGSYHLTVEDTRFFHCNTKTLNLLPNVVAAQHAKEAGCEEAVFIRDGFVTECAHSNVHILKDGVFVTHQADNLILPGIARKHIISACERLGVLVEERPFTKAELMDADEVIVSASSEPGGVLANRIDAIPVGGRAAELFNRIQNEAVREFEAYVEARRA